MSYVRVAINRFISVCVLIGLVFVLPTVAQATNAATLQWSANLEPDLAGYRIYRGTISGVYGAPVIIGKSTSYQFNNLELNKTYYFTVTAFDSSGNESLPSTEVSKTITDPGSGGSTVISVPEIVTPAPGSKLTGTSVTFTYSPRGAAVTDWALRIGTSADDFSSLYNNTGGNVSSGVLSRTVSGLPANGSPIWVTLQWRYTDGTWGHTRAQYTVGAASQPAPSPPPAQEPLPVGLPEILTPAPGSKLTGTNVTFTYSPRGAAVTDWALRIGTSADDFSSLYNNTGGNVSSSVLSRTVSGLPANGSPVWVTLQWRYTDGTWGHTRAQYTAGTSNPASPSISTKVLWRNSTSGEVAVWLMNGMTIKSVGFPGSSSNDWWVEQVGDLNGDGQVDMLWRNANSGVVAIWLMNEDKILSSGYLGGVPSEWIMKGVGDVNGDKKGDVMWRNANNGMVAVWLMNGLSITSVGYLGNTPAEWNLEKVGDVDGDGKADLVWQNRKNGTVAMWLMNGLNVTAVGFPASTTTDWKIQSVSDINGDGKADILWRSHSTGMVAVWLMNGLRILSSEFLGGLQSEWEIKKVSDMNGDGKSDVVLQNQINGKVAVWLMNGASITSVGYPGSTPVNWKIYG